MNNDFPKIIFIGMPDMAVVCLNKLLSSGIKLCAVILPDKINPGRKILLDIALKNNIPVFEFDKTPNEPEFIEKIKTLNADLGVICSFNHKLSKDFLLTAKSGYINCHPSYLPYYRGANPYFHIIKNGEKNSAVTLHFADEKFDTGNIIAQEIFPIEKRETMGMLFSRTNFLVAKMLLEVILHYIENGNIPSKPQPEGDFIKAPNVSGEFHINWQEDVIKLDRLIRASNPFYNALTNFRGGIIRIISGDYQIKNHNNPKGEISKVKKDMMKISAQGGFYLPSVIQAGNWGIYDIKEFIEKFNPKKGEILR